MDELQLLRSARSDHEVPQGALDRGRAALLERADAEATGATPPATVKRRRRTRRIAIGSLTTVGAAALATGLVFANVVGLAGWRGGAEAAAAAVLDEASAAAITSVDPVLQPGEYVRVRTRGVHLSSGQVGDTLASYQYLADDTLFRPADPADDWVWVRGPQSVYATFGPASEEIADAWRRAVEASDSFESGDLLRAPGGAFYGGSSLVDADDLDALPRNPYLLLNHIYRVTLGEGPSPDTEALVYLADRLRSGVVPADLRAAMYQAAAMIPGVEFVDGQATLDGRTGVAIGRVEDAWGTRVEIIIDPATGEFIGEREVFVRDAEEYGAILPTGTILSWTSVVTDVVDTAPAGGTPYGKMDACDDGARGC